MKHSYHAHHAPMGACGSFLLGLHGAPGGCVAGPSDDGSQDVFVGYRYAGEPWTLLPFVRESTAHAAGGAIALLPHGRYGRTLGWASDRWMAQALVLSIATPFESIDDPAALGDARRRLLLTPAVYGLLDFDNSHMEEPVDLVFAIGEDAGRSWCPVDATGDGSPGGPAAVTSADGRWGVGATASAAARVFCDDQVLGVPAAGLVFRILPAGKAVFPVAVGFGANVAITLNTALRQFTESRAIAQERDGELRSSGLGDDARQQVSLATRAFLAATPVAAGMDVSLAAMRRRAGV